MDDIHDTGIRTWARGQEKSPNEVSLPHVFAPQVACGNTTSQPGTGKEFPLPENFHVKNQGRQVVEGKLAAARQLPVGCHGPEEALRIDPAVAPGKGSACSGVDLPFLVDQEFRFRDPVESLFVVKAAAQADPGPRFQPLNAEADPLVQEAFTRKGLEPGGSQGIHALAGRVEAASR
jgi:hypothetical protein